MLNAPFHPAPLRGFFIESKMLLLHGFHPWLQPVALSGLVASATAAFTKRCRPVPASHTPAGHIGLCFSEDLQRISQFVQNELPKALRDRYRGSVVPDNGDDS